MESVEIDGLYFEKFIGSEAINQCVQRLAGEINLFYGRESVQVIYLLKGAEKFSNRIQPLFQFQTELHALEIKTYEGLNSKNQVRIPEGLLQRLVPGLPILILEDIIDSGNTLFALCQFLMENGYTDLKIASLLFKPRSLRFGIHPDFVGVEIGPEFVVGFGMDYNEKGRELDCIYKLKERQNG